MESFNYRRALPQEKSPAVKRLIVFEAQSEDKKTDKWEGIIELPIAEWIMDYGISPKEKRKEVREEGGNGGKGCVKGACCAMQPWGGTGLLRKREDFNPI